MHRHSRPTALLRIFLLAAAALPSVGSCGRSPSLIVTCPDSGQIGIRLYVVDRETSTPPPGAATLVVADGAYADTLPGNAGEYFAQGGIFDWEANRPGSYTLTLRVPGYYDWIASPVVVASDGGPCHRIVPVTLTAEVHQ